MHSMRYKSSHTTYPSLLYLHFYHYLTLIMSDSGRSEATIVDPGDTGSVYKDANVLKTPILPLLNRPKRATTRAQLSVSQVGSIIT
jgi:hypothetical protein